MLNVELKEKLELIEMSIKIQRSDVPRITAVRILPTARLKFLYLVTDIGAELGAMLVTMAWAIAITIPEPFIDKLPTYHTLLSEGSHTFWALCWWIIVLSKVIAIVTGNVYVRRTCFAFGMIGWASTCAALYYDAQTYNVLVGFTFAFFLVSVWNYAKAGLALSQRLVYLDGQERDHDN